MSEYNINQLKKSIKTKALTLFRRCVVRDGGAEAAERPDGLLPEAGAARGQRVGGRAAEVRAHAAADHGRGETGQVCVILLIFTTFKKYLLERLSCSSDLFLAPLSQRRSLIYPMC